MIASFVLVLVMLGCITVLQQGFRMVDDARMSNLASQAMQSQIENVKLLHWGFIGGTPDRDSGGHWYFEAHQLANDLTSETTSAGGLGINLLSELKSGSVLGNTSTGQLARFTSFTLSVENWSIANVRRIQVRVQWLGLDKKTTFTREFVTLYSKDGINDFIVSGL